MNPRRAAIAKALAVLAPAIPTFDRDSVLDRAEDSPGLRGGSPQAAAWLALTSHVRHLYSDYDQLLADGYDRDAARHFCAEMMTQVLEGWGCRNRLTTPDSD